MLNDLSWGLVAALILGVWLVRVAKGLLDVYAYPWLARFGIERRRAPRAYVRALFDGYAKTYDRHVLEELESAVPNLVSEAVHDDLERRPRSLERMLDLGCGTGACGVLLRPLVEELVGVDLSARMVELAAARGVYDSLHVGEMAEHLRRDRGGYDLITAADVVPYLGELEELMSATAHALVPGGLFVFTTEALLEQSATSEPGYRQLATGRFAHHADYVRTTAGSAGLTVVRQSDATLRLQEERPVAGQVHMLRREG